MPTVGLPLKGIWKWQVTRKALGKIVEHNYSNPIGTALPVICQFRELLVTGKSCIVSPTGILPLQFYQSIKLIKGGLTPSTVTCRGFFGIHIGHGLLWGRPPGSGIPSGSLYSPIPPGIQLCTKNPQAFGV